MTKQKKVISKYPSQRRKTFKKHSSRYAKVYYPYLPAIIGFIISLSLILPLSRTDSSVLSYATNTSVETLLESTNQKRKLNNADSLTLNQSLSTAAQQKAQDMATKNYWSHVTPDGKQPWYFIEQTGYSYAKAAENLAYGFGSSSETINGWMNSDQHRKAMLDSKFSEVGFGIVNVPNYQDKGPETIVVALYGQPASGPAVVNADFVSNPANTISLGQILTRGSSPWINLLSGIAIGMIAMFLLTKHSLKLRRKLKQGEQYVLHHPVVDVSLISLLLLLIVLSQTSGFIQ